MLLVVFAKNKRAVRLTLEHVRYVRPYNRANRSENADRQSMPKILLPRCFAIQSCSPPSFPLFSSSLAPRTLGASSRLTIYDQLKCGELAADPRK